MISNVYLHRNTEHYFMCFIFFLWTNACVKDHYVVKDFRVIFKEIHHKCIECPEAIFTTSVKQPFLRLLFGHASSAWRFSEGVFTLSCRLSCAPARTDTKLSKDEMKSCLTVCEVAASPQPWFIFFRVGMKMSDSSCSTLFNSPPSLVSSMLKWTSWKWTRDASVNLLHASRDFCKGGCFHAAPPRGLGMNYELLGLIGLIEDHFDLESWQIEMRSCWLLGVF